MAYVALLTAIVAAGIGAALTFRPIRAEDYLAQGDRLAGQYAFAGAIEAYELARALTPGDPAIALRLARVHRSRRDFAAAEGELAAALAAPATRPAALLEAGDLAQLRGDRAAAADAWTEAAALAPTDPVPLNRLIGLAVQRRDFGAARRHLDAYLALRPNDASIRYQSALILALDDPTTARTQLAAIGREPAGFLATRARAVAAALAAIGPDTDPAAADLAAGQAYLDAGELVLAETVLARAHTRNPEATAIQTRLAYVLTRTGDFDRAAELAGRAVAVAPDDPMAHAALGLARRGQGRLAEARAAFEAGERRFPNDPLFPAELAGTLIASGDALGAEPKYNRAVELAPGEATFHYLLAKYYLDRAWQIDKGLRSAWRAEELRPDDAEIKDLVGWGHYLHRDLLVAVEKLHEAIALDPTLAVAHYHLAVVAEANGTFDVARVQYERARDLARDPRVREAAEEALGRLPLG